MSFEVAVVGLGLIGSAALRRLSVESSVVGIGPGEPVDWSTHDGPFSSHYDSGRVTRRLDGRFEWAVLASRSMDAYAGLEEASGVRFHYPVGMLFVRNDTAGIENQRDVIERLELPVSIGTTDALDVGYDLPAGFTVFNEPAPAGFVDPRRMLKAQLEVATSHGAAIRRTWVTELARTRSGWRLACADGSTADADRVLLATGPYLNDLIPWSLAARVMPEAVVLGRVTAEQAQRLSGLPSLIYLPEDSFQDLYVVPPTRYPDGAWYIKLGGSMAGTGQLATTEAKREWMAGSAANGHAATLQKALQALLPRVSFESFVAKPCLITDTAHGLPYVDEIEDGLFVAVGGCGHAAKSSDALGSLAAGLVLAGAWNDPMLEQSAFAAVFGGITDIDESRHGY